VGAVINPKFIQSFVGNEAYVLIEEPVHRSFTPVEFHRWSRVSKWARGLPSQDLAAGIRRAKGVRRLGCVSRIG
jgi:hypothetical protein